jgi:RNA polymerase sigma-70 factor, ECF subfamily
MLFLGISMQDGGNNDKFLSIYNAYKMRVYNIAYHILKDPYLAEDVTQDVFIILTRNDILAKFERIDSPETKAYIAIITQNVSINLFNKRKKEKLISITEKNTNRVDERDACDNTQQVIKKMNFEDLVITVKKLPRKYYLPMILKYVHELTDKEMARMLDIEEATIRKRLERGRKRLRLQYEIDFVKKKESKKNRKNVK